MFYKKKANYRKHQTHPKNASENNIKLQNKKLQE